MENNTFKSVTFGGFDKQDVIRYIEQASREAAEIQERLQKENDGLRSGVRDLERRIEELERRSAEQERRAAEAEARARELERQLAEERSARQGLEQERTELQAAAEEARRLRPEAEAYAQFRDRVGDIECEAHKRAAALENTTMAQLRKTVAVFQEQYQAAMKTFESSAAYVDTELRKIEVTLSQLPRAMDRTGAELKELGSLLEPGEETK